MNRRLRAVLAAPVFLALAAGGLAVAPALAQKPITAERLANGAPYSFADLIEQVGPAVVSISVTSEIPDSPFGDAPFGSDSVPPEWEWLFREFRRRNDGEDEEPREARSLGSGFFISPEGHVVTNYHVVDGAKNVKVITKDGEELEAEILGSDQSTDLAVLKVENGKAFPYVKFAHDAELRVGDWVVAMGNPFGLGGTATAGIVSATGREIGGQYNSFIQIDAPINRGNSGGPAFDLDGNVIGVNSQIFSPTGGNVGIGFAIPADTAKRIVDALISDGRVVRGWLGVTIQAVSDDIAASLGLDEAKGAIVSAVVSDSPAGKAGFEVGDVVLELDGDKVKDSIDLTRRVGSLVVGDNVRFRVLRDGRQRTINVKIGERPDESTLNSLTSGSGDAGPATDELFGLSLRGLTDEDKDRLGLAADETGVYVERVAPRGEAARKGVRAGEVILKVNDRTIRSVPDFRAAVDDAKAAGRDAVLLTVHDGANRRFTALRFEHKEG